MAKVLTPSRPKDKNKTFVKFLIHPTNGELIAYFSYMNYGFTGYRNNLKTCYAHIGQHAACAPEYAKECRYAKKSEYADLKTELESLGYELKISVNNLK